LFVAYWWGVESEFGAEEFELVALEVADTDAAPAVGGADQGREYEFHRGLLIAESGDDLGSAAFLDKGPFAQVGGPHPDPVAHWDPVNVQQRVEVIVEAATAAGYWRA